MSKPKKPKGPEAPKLSAIGEDARNFNYEFLAQGLEGGGLLPYGLSYGMMAEQLKSADTAYRDNFGGLMSQVGRFAPGDTRVQNFAADAAKLAHGVEKDQIKQSFKEQKAQDRELARGLATDAMANAKGLAAQSTAMYNQAVGQYNQNLANYGSGISNMIGGIGSMAGWMMAGQRYAQTWDPLTQNQTAAFNAGMGPVSPAYANQVFTPQTSPWTQYGQSFMGTR